MNIVCYLRGADDVDYCRHAYQSGSLGCALAISRSTYSTNTTTAEMSDTKRQTGVSFTRDNIFRLNIYIITNASYTCLNVGSFKWRREVNYDLYNIIYSLFCVHDYREWNQRFLLKTIINPLVVFGLCLLNNTIYKYIYCVRQPDDHGWVRMVYIYLKIHQHYTDWLQQYNGANRNDIRSTSLIESQLYIVL